MSLEDEFIKHEPTGLASMLHSINSNTNLEIVEKNMTNKRYNITVETCVDWDDSERRFKLLGSFETEDELIDLIESTLWEYNYQDELTETVVKGVFESLEKTAEDGGWGCFTLVEDDDIAECGVAMRYSFELSVDY